jgi:transcriptional regulator with XRE-family HTH domain
MMMPLPDADLQEAEHNIDVYLGGRLRAKRLLAGLSQQELGAHVHITFQQIQKYERAMNRISASRLCSFSRIFGEPVAEFFTGLPGAGQPADGGTPPLTRWLMGHQDKDTLEILQLFFRIEDAELRKQLKRLLKQLATYPKG